MELDESLQFIARLSRTKNYPKDEAGLVGLAEGLIRAAAATGANPQQIVMVCATTSEWCPTDFDLMTVAKQISDEQKRAQEALEPSLEQQWRKEYGTPKPFDWKALDMDKVRLVKAREKEMFNAIKRKYPGELDWHGMAQAARELGYEDYAKAWERGIK